MTLPHSEASGAWAGALHGSEGARCHETWKGELGSHVGSERRKKGSWTRAVKHDGIGWIDRYQTYSLTRSNTGDACYHGASFFFFLCVCTVCVCVLPRTWCSIYFPGGGASWCSRPGGPKCQQRLAQNHVSDDVQLVSVPNWCRTYNATSCNYSILPFSS